jgi:anti-anti-sigma factor
VEPVPPSPGPTVVVDIEGGLGRREQDAARLREKLRGLLSEGYRCIFVNVARITYLDTVMLGAIAQGYISAMKVGGTVKLLHASPRVKELLAVTKLNRVLEVVESAEPQ